jgi:UPF0755 protein
MKLFKFKNKNFSEIPPALLKKIAYGIGIVFILVFLFLCFEIYIPLNPNSRETVIYSAEKGMGNEEIAKDLKKLGIIRSANVFNFYVLISLQDSRLQAGEYNLSPKMSIYQIVKKMVKGDVLANKLVIPEGWNVGQIAEYLQDKGICTQDYFVSLTEKDYSAKFSFLLDKPKDVSLEGYLFPDTYNVAKNETCEEVLDAMLENFDKKLTLQMRAEIEKQDKTIFEVITMASLIEKEVRRPEDKKIVSGILWKRLEAGMPLQLDATVNYVTGKSDPSVSIKDTKVDSPYNTYKYKGLPKGPISNPGIESIEAALNPKQTKYWFYLSNGATYFSETFEQHNSAKAKYLN